MTTIIKNNNDDYKRHIKHYELHNFQLATVIVVIIVVVIIESPFHGTFCGRDHNWTNKLEK